MSTFGERFKIKREAKGISQRALGALIGVSGSAISQWETGATSPDKIAASYLQAAATALKTTIRYLLTGRDTLSVSEQPPPPYLRELRIWSDPNDLPPDQYVMLPKLEYYLSAGNGGPDPDAFEACDKGAAFRADFAAKEGWTPKTHFTMGARGESMEPTIQNGAPVVIAINEKTIRSGRVYAILIDGEPLLKRLDKLPGGMVRVRSDNISNPAYASYEVSEESIEVIGRAVWTPIRL